MTLAAAVGLIMILIFIIGVMKRWLSPYVGLAVVPLAAGMIYCLLTGQNVLDVFEWVYSGVFYAVEDGEVSAGTVRSAMMVLFACTYFTLMMQVGLFDPLVIAMIKLVKGDPMKIMVASTLVAAGVSLDGDGTSTVLITTAAFVPLYKQFGIKTPYLALLICLPTSVFNMSPWGGPLARVLSALNLDVTELFPLLLPGMGVALIYCVFVAWFLGKKERKRLGYDPANASHITAEELEKMCDIVRNNDPEYKRPKLVWFNLILSVIIMILLIGGYANSAVLFGGGLALALLVNFGFDFHLQKDRLAAALEDGMPAAAMIVASGFLMGILTNSGMGDDIAIFLASLVPSGMENLLPLFVAILGIPGMVFLSSDGYYFGILPVLAGLAAQYGISATAMGVGAMIPLATYYATPLIAWIWILIERCEVDFGEHQKQILKWGLPMFVIYCVVAVLTGAIPLF
ncbi:TRAP transporter large permease subunit [Collinsella tanakaei]|uniref:citrate:proton symporter n=1 Tax=Collinsella sp. An271 TaxID=1965616 RepID=UPI000B366A6B|nr:citrate:proton symporter [Collinsella sp. An271]MBM6687921.1 TRAP transporter large permease subunit [Collinsella tanakaei]OUO59660.1 hypothetical protein B5F74_08355 [Collinsella sp. An271]